MKYRLYGIWLLLVSGHFYLLKHYGISSLLTTLLAYVTLYLLIRFCLHIVRNGERRRLIDLNIRVLFILLFVVECFLTLVFRVLNNHMEDEKFLFFSEYKRAEQSKLLQALGIDRARFVFTDLYLPNSSRVLERHGYTYTHTYNELGTRGPLPGLHKDPNEYRVVLLGDSFAEGEGAPDDSTIAVRLQYYLNQAKDDRKFTVINAGISGSSPVYEQELYHRHIQAFQPDLVIQAVYANDLYDINVMLHSDRLPPIEYPWAVSHIYRILYVRFINPDYIRYGYSEKPAAENKWFLEIYTGKLLRSFGAELAEKGRRLIITYIPGKDEFSQQPVASKDQESPDLALLYDPNFLYALADTAGMDPAALVEKYYWKHDAHLNGAGYDRIAQVLAEKILLTRDQHFK